MAKPFNSLTVSSWIVKVHLKRVTMGRGTVPRIFPTLSLAAAGGIFLNDSWSLRIDW
ncbi:MAG TPA: hypothetical protein VFN23_04960 [Ktedonobacteraceae bacterium]|nr:hypothetical protein [Ktedonobacteraceae bacterium]